jgi:divalent metal cation (Fe/Co/Zn/Cd) transporter
MAAHQNLFPMTRAERAALTFLMLFSVFAFLPSWRSINIAGMALTGWLMAALMVISPVVTLWVFRHIRQQS